MRYSNYVKKINETLSRHKVEIDRLIAIHKGELQSHEAEVEAMHGIYAESFIEQYRANWKPKADYSDAIRKSSERAVLETDLYLSKIKKELDKYFDSPVRVDFANKINAISMTGLGLKDREFALLIESASNYMEMRLVQHLAESRTKQATVSNINEHGNTEHKQVTVQNPYYVELPDIDYTYRAFDEYASSVRTMAKFYAGEKAELKEHLGAVSEYASLNADSYFRNNALDRFSQTMDKANSCLPEHKVKTALTESEVKLIDTMIDSRYPALAEAKVKALAEADSDIAELLSLDERYKGFLETEE